MKFSKIRMEIDKNIVDIDFTKDMKKGMLDSGKSHPTQLIVDTRFKKSNSKLFKGKKYRIVELFANYISNNRVNQNILLQEISHQAVTEEFFEELSKNVWTSRARKEKVPALFMQVLNQEITLEEAKEKYLKSIRDKKNRIIKSLTQNKILYEIGDGNNPTIIPQTTSGKILQALTNEVVRRLNDQEKKMSGKFKTGKDILEEILSSPIEKVVGEYFKQEQNKGHTKNVLLENKSLIIDDQKLLCENNLIYLCYEGLEQFLKKSHSPLKRKNMIFYNTEDGYRKKISQNIRGIIHNKMTSQAIEGGKILFYYKAKYFRDKIITIPVLQRIKARETYFKNVLDSVAFCYHSLKGRLADCVKSETALDNIDNSDFIGTLGGLKTFTIDTVEPLQDLFLLQSDEEILSPQVLTMIEEMGPDKDENKNEIPREPKKEVVRQLLQSIQTIRHTSTHYQTEIQDKKSDILAGFINQAIQRKIDLLGASLADKFKSNNFFKYYTEADLTSIFSKITFNFMEKPTVYPSFAKVLKRAKNNDVIFNTSLVKYLRKLKENQEAQSEDVIQVKSCEYLLQNIYMHYFRSKSQEELYKYLQEFIKSPEMLQFINGNGKFSKQSYKTTIIPLIKEQSTFPDVLIALQKLEAWFLDPDNRKRNKEEHKENYIQSFKLDFFGYVFFKRIVSEFGELKARDEQSHQEKTYDTIRTLISNHIDFHNLQDDDKNYKEHLYKWFIFISLLDNKVISELKQQTHRYLSSIWPDWFNIEANKKEDKTPQQLSEAIQLFTIFLHCNEDNVLTSRRADAELVAIDAEDYAQIIHKDIDWLKENFIDENLTDKEMEGIYIQGNEYNSITHNNILKIKKYSSLPLISQVIKDSNTKITGVDLANYKRIKESIDVFSKNHKIMHKKILDAMETSTTLKIPANEVLLYRRNINQLYAYNKLSNKILLNDVKKLNHILTSLHSRYVKYMQKLERDTAFVQYFLLGKLSRNKIKPKEIDKILYYNQGFKNLEKGTEFLLHLEKKSDVKNIRNYISHYSLFTKKRINNKEEVNKSFIDAFNDIRAVMSYDRKTLNSLPSMFKNTLSRYNVEICFEFMGRGKNEDGLKLVIKSLSSRQDEHLKFSKSSSDILFIDSNSKSFMKQLECLLNYNPPK